LSKLSLEEYGGQARFHEHLKPRTINIKENSEICARVVPTKKLFLLVYPNNAIRLIKINGLKIKTSKDKIIAFLKIGIKLDVGKLKPRIIKKIIKKKSLKGLILELISVL